jgi:3-carboxy-cis,cis-muconate cycloisomerase
MSDPAVDLLGPLTGDRDVARHFTGVATVQAMLDVEAALAAAQAELGVVPVACVDPIARAADASAFDLAALAAEAATAGNLAIPLVARLRARVAETDADAALWVHWGATSQDVIDTALVLQLRASAAPLQASLARAARASARLAREHAGTAMAARTWLQQAVPITFGVKAVGWLDGLDRVRRGLDRALADVSVVQFGGAGGTMAALGAEGPRVAERLAARLELEAPGLPWHAQRDRVAAYACALGVACGALGKVARDVALLAQTEVGEASVDAALAGGSSSMPQKQNPVPAAVALAAALRVPGLVASVLAAMPQEHERGLGGWQAEWTLVPEIVQATGGAARAVADTLDGLRVDTGRMRANLDASGSGVLAEAAAMLLAPRLGREAAHRAVGAAARRARAEDVTLAAALASDPQVAAVASADELTRAVSPDDYVQAAADLVRHALDRRDPA